MANWNKYDSVNALCTVVGTGEQYGITCGGVPRNSLVQPISVFCATSDRCDRDAASVTNERVRHDNSAQNA